MRSEIPRARIALGASREPSAAVGVGCDEPAAAACRERERWQRVDHLFAEALALEADRRPPFLEGACGADSALRREVEALLAEEQALGSFLERPAVGRDAGDSHQPAQEVGPYRILGRLGTGGMGEVFLAEQRRPVERRVALKLIRPGLDSEEVLARFDAERQALALMEHGNIARVFDAGTTADGRSYFAMEYVPGKALTEHCDAQRLDPVARVRLFLQVCAGVQHAHQKALIHRDLKPSNLLVRKAQSEPATVKIIDFGIAKSLQRSLCTHPTATRLETFVGTPAYSSPEQILRRSAEPDTRSDLYSLGVVLYELLVGAPPHAEEEFTGKTQVQIAEMLAERPPPTPAVRLTTMAEAASSVAHRRSQTVEQLKGVLRGDIAWILLRCLEGRPEDRYASVSELRRDLERWLDDLPIEARPATGLYRLRKLVRRHRAAVLVTSLVTLALVATTTAAVVGFVRAERSAEAARRSAREAELAAEFQVQQLQTIDPAALGLALRAGLAEALEARLGASGLAREAVAEGRRQLEALLEGVSFTDLSLDLLDEQIFARAEVAIEQRYGEAPLLQARLWQSIADTLRELGRLEDAVEPQERALELRRRELGPDHVLTLEALRSRGHLRLAQGRLDAAAVDLEAAASGLRTVLGAEHPETLASLLLLGELDYQRRDLESAEARTRLAVDGLRRQLGEQALATLDALNNLAVLLVARDKLAEAEPLHRLVLEGRRRELGENSLATLQSRHNSALLFLQSGRPAEAETFFRETLAGKRRVLGDEHPRTLNTLSDLGRMLQIQGRLDEAEPFLREALETRRRVLGATHPATLVSLSSLGALLAERGELTAAEDCFRQTYETRRRLLGDDNPLTLSELVKLAAVRRQRGQPKEALPHHQRAVEIGRRASPGPHQLGIWLTEYGRTLAALGRFEPAEQALTEGLALLQAAGDTAKLSLGRPLRGLAELHEAWHAAAPGAGHDAQAARWRRELAGLRPQTPARKD